MGAAVTWAGFVGWALFGAAGWCGEPAPPAVVVELFTSEGCSSCPPADKLLERLDRLQPLAEARIIAMSEHVDYWNGEGWTDPYSSAEWTRRQQDYAARLSATGPYTPQMVIDGRWECVGGDGAKVKETILKAARAPKLAVRIEMAPGSGTARVEVGGWRGTGVKGGGDVFVAFAEDSAEKEIRAGENRGVRLGHVAVVRKLRDLGKVDKDTGFRGEIAVEPRDGERLIALAQERGTGRVVGAATLRVAGAGYQDFGTMKEGAK